MLDIKFIRDNVDIIKEAARKKKMDVDIDHLLKLDDERRSLLGEVEKMRAEQNEATKRIAQSSDESERQKVIEEMQDLKAGLQEKEERLKSVMQDWRLLMLKVPNIPDMAVPEGDSDEDNQEIKRWGEQTQFSFAPKSHIDLMLALDMVDLERGAKVAGFRGYFLKNDGVALSYAIWNAAREMLHEKSFSEVLAPSLVRREPFVGTGYLPDGEEDLYKTQDDTYLAGTSEVALMGYYMDEVISREDLPIRFAGFSPCFRREAGSYGKDTKGLIRVHEFYKWEQVILCEASHEESVKWHEWINRNTEEFIELLNIPYRTVVNCSGDLGLGQVKKYDIELWVPLEEKYREIGSASYFHDFQTRRLNIRYKDGEDKIRFAHSLNSTAIPTPRILVSIIENYQQKDGSIKVPDVLQKYMGKEKIEQ